MSIEATIELSASRLVWPQTAVCRTLLRNDGTEVLEAVNRRNRNATPSIVCRDLATGEASVHADVLQPDFECPATNLEPGGELSSSFSLSRVLRFPACGTFEIAARWDTALGSIESEPVIVEVVPSIPLEVSLASVRGSLSGDAFAVWTNDDPDDRSLWLTSIGTGGEGAFDASQRICTLDGAVRAYLSVPANTIPTNRFAAWIEGDRLRFVRNPGEEPASVDLGTANCRIVPPLFEDPWAGGKPQDAEALLLAEGNGVWSVRIAVLSSRPILSQTREFKGASPDWCASVYRSGGERFTFFTTGGNGEDPTVRLGIFSSKLRSIPGEPVFPAEWRGRLLAADVALTADDRVVGAVLVERRIGESNEYSIHKWLLDQANEFARTSVRLAWNPQWAIRGAVVRVNDNSAANALIRGGPEDRWYWGEAKGELTRLAAVGDRNSPSADIVFMGGTEPAVLFAEPGTGFRLQYLGSPRVIRPRG